METRYQHAMWMLAASLLLGLPSNEDRCDAVWWRYGLALSECPAGELRQTAQLSLANARRGAPGFVTFGAIANYVVGDSETVQSKGLSSVESLTLALVDAKDAEQPIAVTDWSVGATQRSGKVTLPEVPDGDYKLRARYATKLGKGEVDLPIALYTPARIHVLTDRPLYEPGNLVRFRAVVLRARDLAPLDHRPGRWIVKSPDGEVLLEEAGTAGEWGVVEGSFPLDAKAPTGAYHVAWVSNDATDDVPFTVEPFTLPRFRVEAAAEQAFYRPSQTPLVRGQVTYSSGAPVANAQVDVAWSVEGDWPPPTEWLDTKLPKHVTTGANGRFTLAIPTVPADLQGKATLVARLGAVDPAGDRVESTATVQLSQDGIAVDAVTELADGLVQGFNNRLYLRVTTPDGQVLPNAKITVARAWEASDLGTPSQLDEDGVAQLQFDPGAPVNIVIPAAPYRPAPKAELVTRGEVEELIGGEGAALADQVEMDRWLAPLAACAKWADDGDEAKLGVRVGAGGNVILAAASKAPLDRCVAGVVQTKRLPAGAERLYTITFSFGASPLASVSTDATAALGDVPDGLADVLDRAAKSARDCIPLVTAAEGDVPMQTTWRIVEGSKQVTLGTWFRSPAGGDATAAVGCLTSRIGPATQLALDEPAEADGYGLVKFSVELPVGNGGADRPQATTMLGYELLVTADLPGKPSTKVRIAPGAVPDLRLRVDPILAKPGDTVTAQLLRGPEFKGTLPTELVVKALKGEPVKVKLDDDRKAAIVIDAKLEGWVEVLAAGKRALVYVQPKASLGVAVKPDKDRYAPRDEAQLQIQTVVNGKPGRAAVGLFGVDASLAQLVTLPGAAELSRVRPKVETSSPAFGSLDGQALALGQIRGSNAAAATVLRVSAIPPPPALDAVVNATITTTFDSNEALVDRFYTILAELHVQARAWEAAAPAAEKLQPRTLAKLWQKALAAVKARGGVVTDAFGRPLVLHRLAPDLLALTDPRAVAVVGTRLPEDIENWSAWVAKEKP